MNEAELTELAATIADRLCGQNEHGSVADCRRSAFCNHGHFFATAEAGATWQHNQLNAVILPVADAHGLGRLLAQHRAMRAQT